MLLQNFILVILLQNFILKLITHIFPGNLHEVLVELEGMGGGGKLHLEVSFLMK